MAIWQLRVWVGALEPLVLRGLPDGPASFARERLGSIRFLGNTPAEGLQVSTGSNSLQYTYPVQGLENERQRSLLGELLIRQNPPDNLIAAGFVNELGNLNFEDQTQRINLKEIIAIGSRTIVPGSAVDIDGVAIADGDLPTVATIATDSRIIKAHFRSKCIISAEDVLTTLRGPAGGTNYSDLRFNIVEHLF